MAASFSCRRRDRHYHYPKRVVEFHAMKTNFQAMTIQELKAYLLEHRNDTEAFHALMDKIKTGDNLNFYSAADVHRFPELLAQTRNID